VFVTPCGYRYVSRRLIGGDKAYIRHYQFVLPWQQMRPSIVDTSGKLQPHPTIDGHMWVPIDDESTYVYNIMYGYDEAHPLSEEFIRETEKIFGRGEDDLIPGTFRLKRNQSNDYLIDRQLQKQGNLSGVVGVNTQDYALQEGMGKIADRTKEFLFSTDRAIVAMRRQLLEAIRVVEEGGRPRGVDPAEHGSVRPHDDIVLIGPLEEKLVEGTVAKF
ncbi:MAG: hypothetical protein AB7K24_31320, partial [Gemmataceae bacterium]